VALLALALTGCGIGIVYPQLDTISAYYVGRLVTLDDAQSAQLDRLLGASLARHRASELDRYAAFLRGLAGTVEGGADAGEWQEAAGQVDVFWRDIGAVLAPAAIEIGRTLTDEQVSELLANLAERDEEEWQEFAERTPTEQLERRQKMLRRALERFTGRLDARQRALLDAHAVTAGSFMPEWRENRRTWREALAVVLAERGSGAEFERRMTLLMVRPDDLWTPQYRAAIERSRAGTIGLLAALDVTLTPGQRDTARRKLASLADQLAHLAQPDERKRRA
jgi:hypothetical protein